MSNTTEHLPRPTPDMPIVYPTDPEENDQNNPDVDAYLYGE